MAKNKTPSIDLGRQGPHLELSEFERLTTRFFATQITADQLPEVRGGKLRLSLDDESIRFWADCMSDDLIVLLCTHERLLIACRIVDKTLVVSNNPIHSADRAVVVKMEVCGESKVDRVPWSLIIALVGRFPSLSHASFAELWTHCRAQVGARSLHQLTRERPPIIAVGDIEIRFASSRSDLEFIARIATFHPFGAATAPIILMATVTGQNVGALLGDFSRNNSRHHSAPWRVFRDEYVVIRRSAMRYVRLYDDPAAKAKFRIHNALAEAYEYIAPSLLNEPISMIESVSYDYHPVAAKRGYNIEPPGRPEGSFYYWKPFSVPSVESQSVSEKALVRNRVHDLLLLRRRRRYLIAPGAAQDIAFGLEKKAWAIKYNANNTGLWHLLSKGDIIFLKDRSDRIRGYGIVEGTKKYRLKGREEFPLWIDFSETTCLVNVDVTEYVASAWYRQLGRGGLVEIPSELGASTKQEVDNAITEGKMWVQPNPYLLHRTTFEIRHAQVFVVQAFDLSTTVLPVIREILTSHSYSVKYSGDRRGQVIFEDIWLMLNESEVVLVDFTLRRPNVYLEFGMALVLGKPIIAITQDRDHLPSDTPELKYILYSDRLGDKTLASALPEAIRDTVEDISRASRNPDSSRPVKMP